ncbi:sensor histidine kinase [Paenibacillus eucommiae]|uniref:Two-component system sensor histidine kinase YesM n=1 Tax=Paenibacillus eucommiae TaxID=1355755 RepID=A0ABS4J8V4_9BACL|nr:sensor histidine kinase [Paenibacillus eucommiae]MBP1996278.1 two-component system sensor histidine kinase YesM [Paenibacillus eucommiae]
MKISMYRSLQTRFIVFLVMTILFTSGPTIYYMYKVSQNNMEQKSSDFIITSMDHISDQFDDLVTNMYKNMLVLTTNKDLWEFLRNDYSLDDKNSYDVSWIRNQISAFRTLNISIYSVFILDFRKQYVISSAEGALTAIENSRVSEYTRFMFDPENNVLQNKLIFAKDDGRYFKQFTGGPSQHNTYSVIVPIRDIVLGPTLGVMVINLADTTVTSIFENTRFAEGSKIHLVDANGVILSSTVNSEVGQNIPHEFTEAADRQGKKVKHDHKEYLITKTQTLYNNWEFISVTPYQALIRPNQHAVRNVFTYILIALIAVSLVLISLIQRFFYRPINRLLREIRQNNNGLQKPLGIASGIKFRKDEVGYIFQSFNDILEDKELLLNNMYSQKLILQDTKIRLLYSQINPHFLYNTLDNIRWLAMGLSGGENRVSQTIQSLSDMLRNSAKTDKQIVDIEEELLFLDMYLNIQRVRYGDKIDIQWNVSDETKKMKIIKFILQPLLENAIAHGIEKLENKGLIYISIHLVDGRLSIQVTDEGVGMDKERLELVRKVIEGTHQIDNKGIGLRNIFERMRWFYGEEAEMTIESKEGKGTVVKILLPLMAGDTYVQSIDSGR